jgi:hypothetical protein
VAALASAVAPHPLDLAAPLTSMAVIPLANRLIRLRAGKSVSVAVMLPLAVVVTSS